MNRLNLRIVALALGLASAITFTVCVLWDLVLPTYAMTRIWQLLLPGFRDITPGSYLLGLVETFLYGVYAALVFVPLYNWLSGRVGPRSTAGGVTHA